MNHPAKRRRGAAMVLAVAVLSLVVTTLAMLAVSTSLQVRRTMILAEEAQLRQLLVAGTQSLSVQLDAANTPLSSPVLPETLRQRGAKLEINPLPGAISDARSFEIEASLPKHHMSQRVVFSRRDGNWQLREASLGG
ncbi:MAG: hypothetical protein M3O30_06400 [Planctomycetota bacterium]|nr:hypothetical protein [Planctomycetota bacterium]